MGRQNYKVRRACNATKRMSVTNFEEITEDLNGKDLFFEPFVASTLRKLVGDKNAKKGKQIVKEINTEVSNKYKPSQVNEFTEVRLRKFVNYYRTHGLIPVCATSKGYFISFENKVLQSQVKSLKERASGILLGARGLEKWIK